MKLCQQEPTLATAVSHTTRSQRPGEKHGHAYHFVSHDAFKTLVENDAMVEWATVFDHAYGTSRDSIDSLVAKGKDVFLEIDWQGAAQVREKLPNAISIFIMPPSVDALRDRLTKRSSDTPVVIEQRLRQAKDDMAHHVAYDYVVVNDDFEQAVEDLSLIIRAARLRQACFKG